MCVCTSCCFVAGLLSVNLNWYNLGGLRAALICQLNAAVGCVAALFMQLSCCTLLYIYVCYFFSQLLLQHLEHEAEACFADVRGVAEAASSVADIEEQLSTFELVRGREAGREGQESGSEVFFCLCDELFSALVVLKCLAGFV